jgi:hypothetical protein
MNLNNKLKGLPDIHLLTLDERSDRQEYTETQYDHWGIKNYTKVSGSKYQAFNYDEWKDLVILNPIVKTPSSLPVWQQLIEISISLTYLLTIKNWLETTNDQYLILMEDDYDLSFIEYWHFDWEYLMNNIPHDWDCIQMSFENGNIYPCYLHPIISGHGTGGSLINRRYAEKLISLYYKDGKFDFSKKICNSKFLGNSNITMDYISGHSGKTYCIPLFDVNPRIGSYAKNILRSDRDDLLFSYKACKKWWTKLRDVYTLEEFFTYGKWNDKAITSKNLDD